MSWTQPDHPVNWCCSHCDDDGTIRNWATSIYDLRRQQLSAAEPVQNVVVDADTAATLRTLPFLDHDCHRAVFAILADGNKLHLTVTDTELDELIDPWPPKPTMNPTGAANDNSTPPTTTSPPPPVNPMVIRMALPELDLARVQRWCAAKVPNDARHEVRLECEVASRHRTMTEHRPPWREDLGPDWISFPIARLRNTATNKTWTLYWRDRHQRIHRYDLLDPSAHIADLLTEIDKDPTGIFWR